MAFLKSSILMLLIAVSTPLLYRQYANEHTVKFMSSYYSNYNVIDQFLRQAAGHIDRVKSHLPDNKFYLEEYSKLTERFNTFISSATKQSKQQDKSGQKAVKNEGATKKEKEDEPPKKAHRTVQCPSEKDVQVRLWSKEELSKYDGHSTGGESKVYLAFLGLVYDVSMNLQHYGPGAEYNIFAGRDATRAFVTGNFTHDLNDDIEDIEESMYSHIETWASFYASSYPVIGRVDGKFYDSRGCATSELARVYQVFGKLAEVRMKENEREKQLPECNTEWNGDLKKGKVWCSPKSGGVEREWAGVPRISEDGQSKQCVCLNLDAPDFVQQNKRLAQYPGCDPNASECTLADS